MLRFQNFLFPTDLSARCVHFAPYVAGIARKFGSEITLLHTLDMHDPFGYGAASGTAVYGACEAEVKKLWGLQEGKPFDGDYPDYFLNRVRSDGIFDNLHKTKAQVNVDDEHHTVDVTLQFG